MSWRPCATIKCDMRIREGLRRHGTGISGQDLADGRFCWKCRRRQAEPKAKPLKVGDRVRTARGRLVGLVGRVGAFVAGGTCKLLVGPSEFTVPIADLEHLRRTR